MIRSFENSTVIQFFIMDNKIGLIFQNKRF
jgi:hypothetical protein